MPNAECQMPKATALASVSCTQTLSAFGIGHLALTVSRIFLLSPANCSGPRARQLMSAKASFDLATRLRGNGAMLGEVFAFVSGLYFRGKLLYALTFARPPEDADGVLVITSSAGLRTPTTMITMEALQRLASENVRIDNEAYRRPLVRSAKALRRDIGPETDVVLLGSIASPKYVDALLDVFGSRLLFPSTFVGRGDMSRGGLMIRAVHAGHELAYEPVAGAVRHGPRPPKLEPVRFPQREQRPRERFNAEHAGPAEKTFGKPLRAQRSLR
jgi:hypothetical protein